MYWRRRLMLVAVLVAVLVLLVLTLKTLTSDGSTPVAGPGSSHSSGQVGAPPSHHASDHSTPAAPRTSHTQAHSTSASTPASTSTTPSGSGSAIPAACTSGQLKVQATTDKKSYTVGDEPVLSMLITNTGPRPCVQNLADSQIVLRVYNGAARVWGSHDCQIEPGTDDRTLAVNAPVKVNVPWSGLTSQPNCAGTRQRVGAGTYTLYPTLSGAKGTAAQFSIVGG